MKAAEIRGTAPALYASVFDQLKGVDFSTDATQIDRARAPFAPNLMAGPGGFPEKRPGWRTVLDLSDSYTGGVNGLFHARLGGAEINLCHIGTNLLQWTPGAETAPVLVLSGLQDAFSAAFVMDDALFIVGAGSLLTVTQEAGTASAAVVDGYVPTITFAAPPAGGGTALEPVNMLTRRRKRRFIGDGTATVYQVESDGFDPAAPVAVRIRDESTGLWAETTAFTRQDGAGTVTFTAAPWSAVSSGEDNVEISCAVPASAGRTQERAKIDGCTVFGIYAGRVFLTGNAAYPAFDWHSGSGDPTYFPDTGYTRVGADNTAIMGYRSVGEYQAIIKEDSAQDATIWLRSTGSLNGETVFPLKQGVAGAGAVSKRAFGNLLDDPLFLSREGVLAVASNAITAERTLQNRSYYLNARLTEAPGLQDACCVTWNGMYILSVGGGTCYILDGRQAKSWREGSGMGGSYCYESYHWEHVPARCFLEHEGTLWFGTEAGTVCRFNSDIETMARYSDDGAAVVAARATMADSHGDFMRYKTMVKKGSGVMLQPFTRSSVKCCVRTDRELEKQLRYQTMDIFDWADIDFTRFTFSTDDSPQIVPFKKKVKKYKWIQIIVRSDGVNEGFGVYGIIVRYQKLNLV